MEWSSFSVSSCIFSQWEEMKHDTRETVRAPAHPLPENTSARARALRPVIYNSHWRPPHTHTRTRHVSGRAGETVPQEPETNREPSQEAAPAQSSARGQSGLHWTDTARMDKLFACLFTAIGVLVSARAQVFKGKSSCGFMLIYLRFACNSSWCVR